MHKLHRLNHSRSWTSRHQFLAIILKYTESLFHFISTWTWTSISSEPSFARTAMRTNSVSAARIFVAFMASIAAFIDVYDNKENIRHIYCCIHRFQSIFIITLDVSGIIVQLPRKVNLKQLAHFSFTSQLWLPVLHSLISTITRDMSGTPIRGLCRPERKQPPAIPQNQCNIPEHECPSPVNPTLQEQLWEPKAFVQ